MESRERERERERERDGLGSAAKDVEDEETRSKARESVNFRVCVRSRRCHGELARSELRRRSAAGRVISTLGTSWSSSAGIPLSFPLVSSCNRCSNRRQFPRRRVTAREKEGKGTRAGYPLASSGIIPDDFRALVIADWQFFRTSLRSLELKARSLDFIGERPSV